MPAYTTLDAFFDVLENKLRRFIVLCLSWVCVEFQRATLPPELFNDLITLNLEPTNPEAPEARTVNARHTANWYRACLAMVFAFCNLK